jgi:hypothetical protein
MAGRKMPAGLPPSTDCSLVVIGSARQCREGLAVIREEASKNVGGRPKQEKPEAVKLTQKIAEVLPRQERETATKAAELFNTNRTYVNQAVKMKTAAPEVFEKVKAGKMTMQDANKAVRAIPTDPRPAPRPRPRRPDPG